MTNYSHSVRKHFIFKGKRMRSRGETSRHIRQQRDFVTKQVSMALKRSLSKLMPRKVLDVGTGFGINVELLARKFRNSHIWSVDPSGHVQRGVREILKSKGLTDNVSLRIARAERLPFAAGHFDLVVSLLSLHHLSSPGKGLREMTRVLAPGGILLVGDWRPVNSAVIPHSPRDIPSARFTTQRLKRLGLSTATREGKYWYLVEGARRKS